MITYDTDVLPFGKHKGKSIEEIAETDPSYLIWAHENILGFNIEKNLYEALLMDQSETDGEYEVTREDLFGD